MNILLGITGGIAAYKMLSVIRLLTIEGHAVKVIMTPHACEFITPLSVKSLSNNEVYIQDFELENPIAHIDLADWAQVLAVAPATANTIAKIAHGMADNLLTSAILAFTGPKIIFPAMNVHMYQNEQTQANLRHLEELSWQVIEPNRGDLACGYIGEGRLPEPEAVAGIIGRSCSTWLSDQLFIVTAGATREAIDPVRFISNYSSGKMGTALAQELYRQGADVILIHGQMSQPAPSYLATVQVESTEELLNAIRHHLPSAQGLYMAAAPADYRALETEEHKIKKKESLNLKLHATTDILTAVTSEFPDKLYVGFALESTDGEKHAADKLNRKNLDFIVLNQITRDFNPLANDQNQVTILGKKQDKLKSDIMTKREIARFILEHTLSGLKAV